MLDSVAVLSSGVVEEPFENCERVITRCRTVSSLPLLFLIGCGPEEGQKCIEKAVVVSISVVAITPAIVLAFTLFPSPVPVPTTLAVAVGGPVVAGL